MRHRPRWRRAERLFAALLLWGAIAGLAIAAVPDAPPAHRLVLAASLDGVAAAEPVLVRRQGATLWMRAADLRALGLPVTTDAAEVALATVPGLRAEIDDTAQTIVLTRVRAVQQVRIAGPPASAAALPVTRNGWGAAINYDASATRIGRRTVAAGLIDAVVHGPRGYFFGGAVITTARDRSQRAVTRLDTGFTTGDPDSARRLTVGDVIAGASEHSRPVRLAGVQLGTDFALRPDLVTFPVPALAGSAAVPSTVDLIVRGSRRSAGEVRAGQFAVTDVPVQTGVNTVTVAVRDVLGRETRRTLSTYVSRALLRPGMTAFSAEGGWVRTGYATSVDRYAGFAGSATLRAGLSERLTAETHAEVGGRVGVFTAGGALGLGSFGLVSASAGISVAASPAHRGGTQFAVTYERLGGPVALTARYVRHGRGWYDLASDHGAPTRERLLTTSVGLDLGELGHAGATVIAQGRGWIARPAGPSAGAASLPASTLASLTYSVRVARRVNLVGNIGRDFRARRSGYLSVAALLVFGRRASGYAGVLSRTGGTSATAEYGQVATATGEVGYRLAGARGGVDRLAGEVSYQGAVGFYGAQVERTNGATAMRVSGRGALIVDGDGVLAADRLNGSYTIVDTRGQADVPVFRDNRPAGRTNRRGKLVVTNLNAYEPTKISLDPLLVGAELVLDRTEHWIRPAARAGVPVRFALRHSRSARVMLVDVAGAGIAAGSRAVVNGGGEVPVGMDGELYAEDLRPRNTVTVKLRGGGVCVATFTAPDGGGPLPRLGPIACRPEQVAVR